MARNRNQIVVSTCPNCGEDIEVSARLGEVRKCPYCRWHYIVVFEKRNRKVLEEYLKVPKPKKKEAVEADVKEV